MIRGSLLLILAVLVVGVAAGLRLPWLNVRSMHADEAVQAARFRDLWQNGNYVYDPHEYHGPTLPYATLPSVLLGGAKNFADTTEVTYRVVPVLFSIVTVLLFLSFRHTLGPAAVTIAALLAAVSPAMVFYGRYYIHESLLACFTLAAMACGWRYVKSRRLGWCLLAGVCVGLMQATKETAVLAYVAAALATLGVWLAERRERTAPLHGSSVRWQHLLAAALMASLVAITLLSSFFMNWRGPLDGLVFTYLPWAERAGGASPHVAPWWFYLQRLLWWRGEPGVVWSEGFVVVLATIGVVYAATARRAAAGSDAVLLLRWLALYTLVITLLYNVIPYKTPWCLLQFLIGLLLLAGVGAACLLTRFRSRWVRAIIAVLLAIGCGHLGWQAYRASFVIPADVGNPYVYAHTSVDVVRLSEQLDELVASDPRQWEMPVKVIWGDAYYWPLPWYLRRFSDKQWWRSMPADPAAAVVIAAPQYDAQLTAQLGQDYIMTGYYELRPQVLMQLWVAYDLWEAYLRRIGRIP